VHIAQEERLARNEAFFREVNERIMDVASGLGGGETAYEFLCECSDPQCTQRLTLRPSEYEHIRANGARFVVVPGHQEPEIEKVTEREPAHLVVEKDGRAGEIAAQLDPRAA
jgi:hypothetical protein